MNDCLLRWSTAWNLSAAATRDVAWWNLIGRASRWFALQRLRAIAPEAYRYTIEMRTKADE